MAAAFLASLLRASLLALGETFNASVVNGHLNCPPPLAINN